MVPVPHKMEDETYNPPEQNVGKDSVHRKLANEVADQDFIGLLKIPDHEV